MEVALHDCEVTFAGLIWFRPGCRYALMAHLPHMLSKTKNCVKHPVIPVNDITCRRRHEKTSLKPIHFSANRSLFVSQTKRSGFMGVEDKMRPFKATKRFLIRDSLFAETDRSILSLPKPAFCFENKKTESLSCFYQGSCRWTWVQVSVFWVFCLKNQIDLSYLH